MSPAVSAAFDNVKPFHPMLSGNKVNRERNLLLARNCFIASDDAQQHGKMPSCQIKQPFTL